MSAVKLATSVPGLPNWLKTGLVPAVPPRPFGEGSGPRVTMCEMPGMRLYATLGPIIWTSVERGVHINVSA